MEVITEIITLLVAAIYGWTAVCCVWEANTIGECIGYSILTMLLGLIIIPVTQWGIAFICQHYVIVLILLFIGAGCSNS